MRRVNVSPERVSLAPRQPHMRVAALYDIHGNLPALEAVLDDVRRAGVDLVVVGGDVLPGPMPRECFEALQGLTIPVHCIRGNGDRVVLSAVRGEVPDEVPAAFQDVVRWTAEQLTTAQRSIIAEWPMTIRHHLPGLGDVLFCHATPRSDTENITARTDESTLASALEVVHASLVVCGHTHMQFDRTVGTVRVINAGSVGMPFGAPGAYWLLLHDAAERRRTSYDLAAAAERIAETAYPQARQFAERQVLHPPTEAAMLELLTT